MHRSSPASPRPPRSPSRAGPGSRSAGARACRRSSCSCRCCSCCRRPRAAAGAAGTSFDTPRDWRRAPAPALTLGSGWFSLGPVFVLGLRGRSAPAGLVALAAYVLALAAQFGIDLASTPSRVGVFGRSPPRPPRVRAGLVDARARAPSACSRRSPRRRPRALIGAAAGRAARAVRPRARGAHRPGARAGRRLPRHRAAARRPARGGRRVHRAPHARRRRAVAAGRRADGLSADERRDASWRRCCTTSARSHIPDAIINKPGQLDADEWAIMKTHTIEGQQMLDRVGGLLPRSA